MRPALQAFRYELRRYHNGERDISFAPAYPTIDWAVEVAHDYADGAEPGTTVEIWDAENRESIAFLSADRAPRDGTRGSDEGNMSVMQGEPLCGNPPDVADVAIPG